MAYRNYATANSRIVDPSGNGDFKTIAAALTASASGQTIFIRPGTYSENPTLVAGVNLCAFDCDASADGTGHVIISGKCTFTGAGTVSISGIQLQTNSDFLLAVTGSAASVVNLINCFFNCTNNTGISFTSSSGSSEIKIRYCYGNLGTTGIALWAHSAAGELNIKYLRMDDSGNSTTANTVSSGICNVSYSDLFMPITTSSTAQMGLFYTTQDLGGSNTTCVTAGGSGAHSFYFAEFVSGTASAISIGSTVTMSLCTVSSSNTNSITGAGTLVNGGISFTNSSYKINTTTQTGRNFDVGGISFDGGTNLLSNYSTGTFTPTMIGSATTGTTTYSTQTGYYTRIGNVVNLFIQVVGSAATGTGNANIGALPFTVNNNAPEGLGGVAFGNNSSWTWPASTTSMASQAIANAATAQFFASASGSPFGALQMHNAAFNMTLSLTHQI